MTPDTPVTISDARPTWRRRVKLFKVPAGSPYGIRPDDCILRVMERCHVQRHARGGYTWWGKPKPL